MQVGGGQEGGEDQPFGVLAAAGAALVGVGLLVLMLVVQARPAGATFPGPNGKIAYAADDGGSGGIDSDIYAIDPTGGCPLTSPTTI